MLTKANSADLATVASTGAYSDLSGKPTIPTVSVSHSGTASSTTARKQQITVNNVAYDVDGSAYMEQEVILSTSADTVVTFTNNELIVDGKIQPPFLNLMCGSLFIVLGFELLIKMFIDKKED
jgi:hypothetical protein